MQVRNCSRTSCRNTRRANSSGAAQIEGHHVVLVGHLGPEFMAHASEHDALQVFAEVDPSACIGSAPSPSRVKDRPAPVRRHARPCSSASSDPASMHWSCSPVYSYCDAIEVLDQGVAASNADVGSSVSQRYAASARSSRPAATSRSLRRQWRRTWPRARSPSSPQAPSRPADAQRLRRIPIIPEFPSSVRTARTKSYVAHRAQSTDALPR